MARIRVPISEEEAAESQNQDVPQEYPSQPEDVVPVVDNSVSQAEVQPLPKEAIRASFFRTPKGMITIGLVFFSLLVVAGVMYVINDRNQLKKQVAELSDPQQQATKEAEKLRNELSAFIELPTDETPTVATVVDATKVQGQPFFAKAQNGDKVILFAKAGKAILYRESTKKIIEVAPINLGNNQTQSQGVENNN